MTPPVLQHVLEGIPPSLQWPVKTCVYTSIVCYILSVATGNVSQVDRIWTFMPLIYTAYFALLPLWPKSSPLPLFPFTPKDVYPSVSKSYNPRALLMLSLVIIWSARLTYNAWRRGMFNLNEEDYRWPLIRKKMPAWAFQLMNITFIASIQNILLLMLGIPTYIAVFQEPARLSASDYILAALALVDLALEFVADNQQWSFQTYKRTGVSNTNDWPGAHIHWTPADAKRGFVTRGLWAWSRHPNFACEQFFWILITFFPILASESPALTSSADASWTSLLPLTPSLALCVLFFLSTDLTEKISVSKYPEAYRAYQQRVAMFVPFLTPVWGWLVQSQGKSKEIHELVWGQGVTAGKKKKN